MQQRSNTFSTWMITPRQRRAARRKCDILEDYLAQFQLRYARMRPRAVVSEFHRAVRRCENRMGKIKAALRCIESTVILAVKHIGFADCHGVGH